MPEEGEQPRIRSYRWPWWLAGFVLLGMVLMYVWMLGAVAEVKRIREATDKMKAQQGNNATASGNATGKQ
ncbi:MAG: hypothetical protein CMO74_16000 [Verrucomicrobiales bacterium]|nr:hypothetical protein [Verrucomicrobiales bacterium]